MPTDKREGARGPLERHREGRKAYRQRDGHGVRLALAFRECGEDHQRQQGGGGDPPEVNPKPEVHVSKPRTAVMAVQWESPRSPRRVLRLVLAAVAALGLTAAASVTDYGWRAAAPLGSVTVHVTCYEPNALMGDMEHDGLAQQGRGTGSGGADGFALFVGATGDYALTAFVDGAACVIGAGERWAWQ